MITRSSGVLLHVTSLPGPFGIGTLGEEAYRFVDKLAEAGIKYWQILPLNPTGPSNSPYASTSCFANNDNLIDPRILASEGYLSEEEVQAFYHMGDPKQVDFSFVYNNALEYLHLAASRITEEQRNEMLAFVNSEQFWLNDYAMFSVLHRHFNYAPWQEWENGLNVHDERAISQQLQDESLFKEMEYFYFVQWQFRRQWDNLKAYANRKEVYIIGDMPIFPALDSADVWANPEAFQLDQQGWPEAVAGVPPDYFSKDGQLWGNPLYDWEYLERDDFRWWVRRTQYQMDLYDVVRIDHFRGFDSYWAVPFGNETAVHGTWRKGPGIALFQQLESDIANLEIIAEDLGDINESVEQLIADTGYPGMKILQFSLDRDYAAINRPYTFTENYIVYTGTHDNSTTYGWLELADQEDRDFVLEYIRLQNKELWKEEGPENPAIWACIDMIWASPCVMAVVPMQDLLGQNEKSRMNTPGTLDPSNWAYRVTYEDLEKVDTQRIYHLNRIFQRLAIPEASSREEEELK